MQKKIVDAVKGFSIYEHLSEDLVRTTPLDRWQRLTESMAFIRSLKRDQSVVEAGEKRKNKRCSLEVLRKGSLGRVSCVL